MISFIGTGSGAFAAESDSGDQLLSISGGYRYIDAVGRAQESYNARGQLTRIDKASGLSLGFTYSDVSTPASQAPAPGYLLSVQDNFGRTMQFSYLLPPGGVAETDGRVNQVIDAGGNPVVVVYDAAGNLAKLTWPDTNSLQFLYENTSLLWALTGEVDENNSRYATIGYDAAGLASSTELAGGVQKFGVTYDTPPQIAAAEVYDPSIPVVWRYHAWQVPGTTTVAMPNGTTTTLGAAAVQGYPRLSTQSQAAGSGCTATSSAITYDLNGNIASRDDFNGSRMCAVSDLSRNVETARVEGLSNTASCSAVTPTSATLPSGSRKTSTAWHPDWRLEAKKAEPGRLTTSVYNGQPDPSAGNAVASCAPSGALLPDGKPIAVLCKTIEQATTDVDGHLGFSAALQSGVPARVNSWTYNQYGQVLTAKGPRTDVNDTTTYAYYSDTTADHTMGDLQTMTNAVGQLTSYTKYNKHGQLLESTDPNGVVTVNTYDLRQRLLSTTVGGQMTTNTYDPVGQLLKVTSPDGIWIGYEYDPAHRQTAMKDSLGNRIEYTLDSAGNKTTENVKDPSGVLKRTLARSIDALGRVQQTTGRE